jgi:hypothetical protein
MLWMVGRAEERKGDDRRIHRIMARVRVCGEEEVANGGAGRSHERLGRIRGLGVEDIEGKEEGGVMRREVRQEWEDQALVPGGVASVGVIGTGGRAAGGIEVGDDVGAEVAAAPVDVLQVLARDDGELQVERLERRHGRRLRRHRGWWSMEFRVSIRRRRVLLLLRVERRVGGRW